jgi:hypothetical protein
MTLRAWIITMRGRVREALCPELQVLRDRRAHDLQVLRDEDARLRREVVQAYRRGYLAACVDSGTTDSVLCKVVKESLK